MSTYFEPRSFEIFGAAVKDLMRPIVHDLACSTKYTYNYIGRTIQLLPVQVARISLIFREAMETLCTHMVEFFHYVHKSTVHVFSSISQQSPIENGIPFFKNYSFKPRAAKKVAIKEDQNSEPSLKLHSEDFRQLVDLNKQKSQVETTLLGKGLQNGGNSCYMAATLQMLRVTKLFRARLQSKELEHNEFAVRIKKVFASIENSLNPSTKSVDSSEINSFRQFLIKKGWYAEKEYSQEDADALYLFLLDKLHFPLFDCKMQVTPISEKNMDGDFTKGPKDAVSSLHLSMEKVKEKSSLAQVAFENVVEEEITDPKLPTRLVETKQTVKIKSDNIPHCLPITLNRFSYDKKTKVQSKIRTSILPSDYLDVPLDDLGNHSARYRLSSVVSHTGSRLNSGHYICYVPAMVKTQKVYFEFNDSLAKLHLSNDAIKEGLEKDSYVFMYELDRVIKT